MALTADPAALSVVRERVRRWLGRLHWPDNEVDDVVMAVNEAVTIVVEHALITGASAVVRVAGRPFDDTEGRRRVAVGVVGDVSWEAAAASAILPGFGVLMLHTCMDSVELCRDADGTTVLLTSVGVPPLAGRR